MDIVNYFEIENEKFYYYDITKVFNVYNNLKKLPIVLKILLEANLRKATNQKQFQEIIDIFSKRKTSNIKFFASRIVMDQKTALEILVDFTSIREKVFDLNPKIMMDVVISSSLKDFNEEKYKFLKWSSKSFSNLRVVPLKEKSFYPINLEFLSTVIHIEKNEDKYFLYPETIIGENTFGILGLNTNILNQKLSSFGKELTITLPEVIGVNIKGDLKKGVLTSDAINSLKQRLKEFKSKNKIVEFYGEGLKHLTLEDRIKILNMAKEFDFLSFFFAIDDKTIEFFDKTRENKDFSKLIRKYLELQNLYLNKDKVLQYDELLTFDLDILSPSVIKGKRINDNISISRLVNLPILNETPRIKDHDVILSLIECFDPHSMVHMALIAKKADRFGLKIDTKIKTFLNSNFELLKKLNLQVYLKEIGFCFEVEPENIDLGLNIEADIKHNNLNVCSISSKEKVFEHSLVKSNYLISSSLVVVYSLIGTLKFNLFDDVIDFKDNKEIRLKDLWPSSKEVSVYLEKLNKILYQEVYQDIFKGNEFWNSLEVSKTSLYNWDKNSTNIKIINDFSLEKLENIDIENASILALFEDSISTKQISPKGQISLVSTTAKYLESKGIKSFEFDTFENRSTNYEVMIRGIFDTSDVHNLMVSKRGSFTMDYETNEIVSIYEKAIISKIKNEPLIIFAGKDFGIGEFDEWAIKGIKLLGVKAIIASSFCEEYREALVKYAVLPLEFVDDDIESLKLKGQEKINIKVDEIIPDSKIKMLIKKEFFELEIELKLRLDTFDEVEYFKYSGILPFTMKDL